MAKVVKDTAGVHHLRGIQGALCGAKDMHAEAIEYDGVMTCPECAKIALRAMELVTRAEKREWRKL